MKNTHGKINNCKRSAYRKTRGTGSRMLSLKPSGKRSAKICKISKSVKKTLISKSRHSKSVKYIEPNISKSVKYIGKSGKRSSSSKSRTKKYINIKINRHYITKRSVSYMKCTKKIISKYLKSIGKSGKRSASRRNRRTRSKKCIKDSKFSNATRSKSSRRSRKLSMKQITSLNIKSKVINKRKRC